MLAALGTAGVTKASPQGSGAEGAVLPAPSQVSSLGTHGAHLCGDRDTTAPWLESRHCRGLWPLQLSVSQVWAVAVPLIPSLQQQQHLQLLQHQPLPLGFSFCGTEAELSVPSSRPVNLLGLLKWRSQPSLLAGNLQNLMHVDGGEVIKVQQIVPPARGPPLHLLPSRLPHSPLGRVPTWLLPGDTGM